MIDFWHACEHLRVASDHTVAAHSFEKHRDILRHAPACVARVIRAQCHLLDRQKQTGPRSSGNWPSSRNTAIACATMP